MPLKGAGAYRGSGGGLRLRSCLAISARIPMVHEVPNLTITILVKSVKATGGIGVVGVFLPKDPEAFKMLWPRRPDCLRFRQFLD